MESDKYKEVMNRRYHSYSTYDQSLQSFKSIGKVIFLWLVCRELPLRHFYARCAIGGVLYFYLFTHNWKNNPLEIVREKPLYYWSKWDYQTFENYPFIDQFVNTCRIAKKNSPGLPEEELWLKNQYPSFYMHHFKNYRYIFRSRRVVPWDGTFNQPIYPYSSNNDRTGLVHNGTNEIIEPGQNGLW